MENKNKITDNFKSVLKGNTMIFILVGVMILFEILIRSFGHGSLFAPANITNIIRQNAYVAILATGMLLCILTGGNIDLSVGSVVALVGALAGVFIVNLGMPVWLAICLCLLIGTLIGAFHGFFIAYIHIPPFITTLAGMLLWRGVATIVLDGKPIAPFPQKYLKLFESFIPNAKEEPVEVLVFGELVDKNTLITTMVIALVCVLAFIAMEIISRRKKIKNNYTVSSKTSFITKLVVLSVVILIMGQFLARDRGLPVVLILLGVIVAAYSYFTQNTVPGRYLYAIGGNAKAAKLSGVNTDNVLCLHKHGLHRCCCSSCNSCSFELSSANCWSELRNGCYRFLLHRWCFCLRWNWYSFWCRNWCYLHGCIEQWYVNPRCRYELAARCKGSGTSCCCNL